MAAGEGGVTGISLNGWQFVTQLQGAPNHELGEAQPPSEGWQEFWGFSTLTQGLVLLQLDSMGISCAAVGQGCRDFIP